jgi:hypothetical protein
MLTWKLLSVLIECGLLYTVIWVSLASQRFSYAHMLMRATLYALKPDPFFHLIRLGQCEAIICYRSRTHLLHRTSARTLLRVSFPPCLSSRRNQKKTGHLSDCHYFHDLSTRGLARGCKSRCVRLGVRYVRFSGDDACGCQQRHFAAGWRHEQSNCCGAQCEGGETRASWRGLLVGQIYVYCLKYLIFL